MRRLRVGMVVVLIATSVAVMGPARASWPGTNGMLAATLGIAGSFSTDRQVYLMNLDGSGRHALTSFGGNGAFKPQWSPDGNKILWWEQGGFGGYGDVYVANADGSNKVKVLDASETADFPSFSRDGTKIVYTKHAPDDWRQVYVMNADGTGKTQITTSPTSKFFARWSPTSDRILYLASYNVYAPDPEDRYNGLWSIKPDGSDRQRLWDVEIGPSTFDISPDGSEIAFSVAPCAFWMYDPESETISPADPNRPAECDPVPENYDQTPGWHNQLYRLDLATLQLTRLTLDYPGHDSPIYSPDGTMLAFGWGGGEIPVGIYTMPVTGGTKTLRYELPRKGQCNDINGCFVDQETLYGLAWQPCTQATADCTAEAFVDLATTLTPYQERLAAGEQFTVDIGVTNNGPHDAWNNSVVVSWDGGATFAGIAGDLVCDLTGDSLTCDLGSLRSSESGYASLTLTAPSFGTVTVTAAATPSGATDTSPANNSAAASLPVGGGGGCTTDCPIDGTAGPDVLHGTAGDDVINAGAGDDTICAGGGADQVRGQGGADVIRGDTATCSTGRVAATGAGGSGDLLLGGRGGDAIFGEQGSDTLKGGGGRDVLDGGSGADRLNGGPGRDTCFFETRREKRRFESCEVKSRRNFWRGKRAAVGLHARK